MKTLTRFYFWLRAIFGRSRTERDMDAELRFHIETRAEDLIRSGISHDEALRRARMEFGGVDKAKEECRDARGISFLESLLQDLRYGLRMLRKSPGFTLAIVLTLALGVGANVTMFSIVDMLLFRVPAHLRQPQEIMRVDAVDKSGQPQMELANYPGFQELMENVHLLELAAQSFPSATDFGRGSTARDIQRNYITHSYFHVLGAQLLIGRPFTADEETQPGGARVVILGYDFWKREFGGDPGVLSREILIDGTEQTVIGVAPCGFTGLNPDTVDVWLPISDQAWRPGKDPITDTGVWWLQVIGRPVSGTTKQQAEAEATSAFRHGGGNPVGTIRLEPYLATRTSADMLKDPSNEARVSLWLMGVALLVFLIACANVTNLFLVRTMQRRQEMAVRLQLGATRSRLIRQMLVESLLVSLAGGMAALFLAYWARPLVGAFLLPPNFYEGSSLSLTMFGLAAGFAVVAGVASGLWPAWKASCSDSLQTLKSGGPTLHQRSKTRSAILVIQVSLTLVLSVGAALFVRSLRSVHAIRLGFDAPHVLVATMASSGYKQAEISAGYERMRQAALTIPGVERAGLAANVPFAGYGLGSLRIAATSSARARDVTVGLNSVSPDYFAAMGMRIIRGRSFLPSDRTGAPLVAIANQSFAREIAPEGNALGRYLVTQGEQCNPTELKRKKTAGDKANQPQREPLRAASDDAACKVASQLLQIVGVVPDERRYFLFDDMPGQPTESVYTPLNQSVIGLSDSLPNPTGLVIRTAGNPSAIERSVASALEVVAPGSRYVEVRPITDLIDRQTLPWRMGASMFLLFGVLALALAAVGIYGVLAFLVRCRIAEIGVRLALGAMPGDILSLVLTRGMSLVATGIVIGIGAAFALARLMQSLLYGIAPTDPVSYLLAAGVVTLVALAACYIPARRAMKVDPMVALRYE
ncbi:MAG: ABC transporter permease [Candidatus Acidiferrales bacterium]